MVLDGMMKQNNKLVQISIGPVTLEGDLHISSKRAIVLFAHGSGSSRRSPRNKYVAEELQKAGLGTLLFDLLTGDEERIDEQNAYLRFDIGLLADRLAATTEWLIGQQLLTVISKLDILEQVLAPLLHWLMLQKNKKWLEQLYRAVAGLI